MKQSIVRNLLGISCFFCLFSILLLLFIIESPYQWIFVLFVLAPFSLLILYTYFYLKRKIIHPLEYLKDEANRIACGDLSHTLDLQSEDEIGEFVKVFDYMRNILYEQELKQAKFELNRKEFVDSISHDLKTPLASISAYVEALQDGIVSTPEEEQQYLEVIMNKIALLNELSKELSMSYEMPDTIPLSLQEVNCYHWVCDFFNDMEVECATKGVVHTFVNNISFNHEASIQIDIRQFERALFNITSNTFRYYKKHFSILAEIRSDQFILYIENDGAQIEQKELDQIFDRFYTKEKINNQGHLGLGLHITKKVIDAMNAQIAVKKEGDIIQFQINCPISETVLVY